VRAGPEGLQSGSRSLGAETAAFGYLRKRCLLNSGSDRPLAIRDMRHVCSTASDGLLGGSLGEAFSSEAAFFRHPSLAPFGTTGCACLE